MRAIVQESYGSPDVLELRDIDVPTIGDAEVLLRVRAASICPGDWGGMRGAPYVLRLGFGLRKPRNGVRGMDVAGTVGAVGKNVTRFRLGDEVFGVGRGTFAEYARVPQRKLARKPANLTFEQAAAVPLTALTALQALRDAGKVQPGQTVLINGASGGVGTFAVQIAKTLGAEVTGVCSPRNADMVRSLGADHVIDYTQDDFTRNGQRYDVILDNVANHSLLDIRRALTPTGTLVPNNGNFQSRWLSSIPRTVGALVLSVFVRQTLRPFVTSENAVDLEVLNELIEAGKITPVIDSIYPLSETPSAFAHYGEGHTRGKVVITV